jgi:hypothetical protein
LCQVLDRRDLVPSERIGGHVGCGDGLEYFVRSANEQTAAFVRTVAMRVIPDRIEHGTSDLHNR